ncbi:unnamed protein product, partial [Symbiodinium sp. KB8]
MTARMMLMLTLVLRAIVDYDDHDNAMTLWAWDIVQIGSAPIQTKFHGRLAADLPHHMFVLSAVLWIALVAYFLFGVIGAMWHENKILHKALLKVEKLHDHLAKRKLIMREQDPSGEQQGRVNYHPAVAPPPMQ